jgi:hypothetical protein
MTMFTVPEGWSKPDEMKAFGVRCDQWTYPHMLDVQERFREVGGFEAYAAGGGERFQKAWYAARYLMKIAIALGRRDRERAEKAERRARREARKAAAA